jgi:hypothetical protein
VVVELLTLRAPPSRKQYLRAKTYATVPTHHPRRANTHTIILRSGDIAGDCVVLLRSSRGAAILVPAKDTRGWQASTKRRMVAERMFRPCIAEYRGASRTSACEWESHAALECRPLHRDRIIDANSLEEVSASKTVI